MRRQDRAERSQVNHGIGESASSAHFGGKCSRQRPQRRAHPRNQELPFATLVGLPVPRPGLHQGTYQSAQIAA